VGWWRRPWFAVGLLALALFFVWSRHPASRQWLPGQRSGPDPIQNDVAPLSWTAGNYRYEALAQFSIQARVLSRHNYSGDREAEIAPFDLALGWGVMSDQAVLDKLVISQSGRWYHYMWSGAPPADPAEMARSSSNMHIVPGSASARSALERVEAGDWVSLRGKLLLITSADGWHWRSSLSRTDTDDGACELFWVDEAVVLPSPPALSTPTQISTGR
jgi:hypothetical protein